MTSLTFLKNLLSFLALLAASAHAQQYQPPSDVDLKSAYCMGVLQSGIAMAQQAIQTEPPGSDEKFRAIMQGHVSKLQTNLNRVQSYLIPKFPYVDSTGLLAASNRGKIDKQTTQRHWAMCIDRCNSKSSTQQQWMSCEAACDQEEPATSRVKTCDQIDWLPF